MRDIGLDVGASVLLEGLTESPAGEKALAGCNGEGGFLGYELERVDILLWDRFLDEEREALGEREFNQEYFCAFVDTLESAFAEESIAAAVAADLETLDLEELLKEEKAA